VALRLTWVAKALNCQVVRSVCLVGQLNLSTPLFNEHSERIAIARALLRNPKVLLLDEVNVCLVNPFLVLTVNYFSGNFGTGHEFRESCASCP
jgi:ABC-type polar amino acid transport system ATPase subunit